MTNNAFRAFGFGPPGPQPLKFHEALKPQKCQEETQSPKHISSMAGAISGQSLRALMCADKCQMSPK